MVSTIHEKVDDVVHRRITDVKKAYDFTWVEFFDWLGNEVFPDEYAEIASMTDDEIKRNLSNAYERGEWLYVAQFAIEADARGLTVGTAEVDA